MICSVFLWKRHFKSPQDRIKTKVRSICVRKNLKAPKPLSFKAFHLVEISGIEPLTS